MENTQKTSWEASYRKDLQKRILSINPAYTPVEFSDFIKRGADLTAMGWNEEMLKNEGLSTSRLRDLCVVLENRQPKSILTQ